MMKLSLLYQSALKNERFEVFRAMNGVDALNILDKQFIDLIISDIMMPDMDGYELAESLREAGYDLPIYLSQLRTLSKIKNVALQ